MIYNLRLKFIKIATASVVGVLLLIYVGIFVLNTVQLNSDMDRLTDILTENDGRFPDAKGEKDNPPVFPDNKGDKRPPSSREIMDKEIRFATRFFVVRLDDKGEVISLDTDSIASIDDTQAEEFAKELVATNKEKGWYSSFRYKITKDDKGTKVVFVDGSNRLSMNTNSLISAAIILVGCGLLVILLIVFFSKRAVKPVAESYEKQKQFITDANHELKTPLTLILANLDIAESELGKNEWLEDIRYEGEQLAVLVDKLVTLTRMDEEERRLNKENFNLSEVCLDIASEYQLAASSRGLSLETDIAGELIYKGDESSIRQLISILMDNALKYCDKDGDIRFELRAGRNPSLIISNSFEDVDNTELDRLFDRFYRSDKARTSGNGYGIGLSIAKAIVEKSAGKMEAVKYGPARIAFKVSL